MISHITPPPRSNSGGSETSDSSRRGAVVEQGAVEEAKRGGRLRMSLHLDYKQDNTLATAAVVCHSTHIALRQVSP